MNSFTKSKPFGSYIIGSLLIFLFFLEIILVTTVFTGMPPIFWLIGIFCLILGIYIIYNANSNYKSMDAKIIESSLTGQTQFTISDEELKKNFRTNVIYAIICWIVTAISAPWCFADITTGGFTMSMATFSAGLGLGLVNTFFAFWNKTNPEGYKAFLEKRKKNKQK